MHINSISTKFQNLNKNDLSEASIQLPTNDTERALMLKLIQFNEVISEEDVMY